MHKMCNTGLGKVTKIADTNEKRKYGGGLVRGVRGAWVLRG